MVSGVRDRHSRQSRPSSNGRSRSVSPAPSDGSGGSSDDSNRGRLCYHCGAQGHVVSQCPEAQMGRPQNQAGAAAYLSDRRRYSTFRPYDSSFWLSIDPSRFREVRRTFTYTGGAASHPSSMSSVRPAVPAPVSSMTTRSSSLAPLSALSPSSSSSSSSSFPSSVSPLPASSGSSSSSRPARHISSAPNRGRFRPHDNSLDTVAVSEEDEQEQ